MRPGTLCIALMLIGSSCFGQSESATLSGRVTDPTGAAIAGAQVVLINADTAVEQKTNTNAEGIYVFSEIHPGNYRAAAGATGFITLIKENLILNIQAEIAENFLLSVGSVSESVTVEGTSSLINAESAAVATVVDRQFVENLPLNGRSFQSLIALTPGIVTMGASGTTGQFSVNGQRTAANTFTVDGVNANIAPNIGNGNLPGLTASGTTQSLASVDDVQEFRVQTSSYSAEFGRSPGGQIAILTRSGTNQIHGSLFEYLRNDKFDAKDWFANRAGSPKPPERQNDFGGTLGGPVLIPHLYNGRKRTFFFFSYEGLRLLLPQFNLTNVPSLALRQASPAALQPILNAFPKPNGPILANGFAEFTAAYSDPSSLDAISARIDHTVNSKVSLFGRYSRTPSVSKSRASGFNLAELGTSNFLTQTITVGATSPLTPHVANDLKVNYSSNNTFSRTELDTFGGATPPKRTDLIPSQVDPGIATMGGATFPFSGETSLHVPQLLYSDPFTSNQHSLNLVDTFSYQIGAHQLKFGGDYRRLTPVNAANLYELLASFSTQAQVLAGIAPSATVLSSIEMHPLFTNLSLFTQDTWKLTRRLTLSFGVRWELNPAPTEANGHNPLAVDQVTNLASIKLAPRGTKEWQTTYNNFAPRFGIAYMLSQTPGRETIVRTGFGLFYDTGNDEGALNIQQVFPYSSNTQVTNVVYPFSLAQVTPKPLPISQNPIPTPYANFYAFDPHLQLPYTWQWNLAVEQALGRSQALTVSYVGSASRRLLQTTLSSIAAINPIFTSITVNRNHATSDYDALQAQFQRRLSRGLQALVSYTWSHALDDDSTSNGLRVAAHGNAAFDIRHVLSGAVTYDIPYPRSNLFARSALGGWSTDSSFHLESARPVDVTGTILINPLDGAFTNTRPNVVLGVPLYVDDPNVPGGRKINVAAFSPAPAGTLGNLGRNQVRVPVGDWQADFAVRREFTLRESLKLQFRGEAFNVFNHPNFGMVQTSLTAKNFGQATVMLNQQLTGLNQLYQIGGPRSLQFAMKLKF